MKSYKFDELLKKEMKKPSFKKEFESLEEEFVLAKEVINLRKKMNMTQKELAEKVGTSQPAIARLESGNYKNVSLSFIRRLAFALNAVPEIHLKQSR